MKRWRALLMVMVALVGSPTQATAVEPVDGVKFDGAWWQALDKHEQLMVVQGMIAGLNLTSKCAWGQNVIRIEHRSAEFLCANWPDGKKQELRSFSKPFTVYVDEISDFYLRHPNRLVSPEPEPAEILDFCFADDPYNVSRPARGAAGKQSDRVDDV